MTKHRIWGLEVGLEGGMHIEDQTQTTCTFMLLSSCRAGPTGDQC